MLAAELAAALDALGVDPRTRYRAELIAEEIVTNLAKYGGDTGPVEIRLAPGEAGLELAILDRGAPFDPETPVPEARDDEPGGLGLMLVRKMAARLDYGPADDGRNRLTVLIAAS